MAVVVGAVLTQIATPLMVVELEGKVGEDKVLLLLMLVEVLLLSIQVVVVVELNTKVQLRVAAMADLAS